MRPTRPEGAGFLDLETQTNYTRTAKTNAAESIGRMIDWCLGLEVDDDDMDIIVQAWRKSSDHEFSLNQSIQYISRDLLLADFELKPTVANRDPLVQLAIWESGALLKKRHHGWDTSMPMPGITISGHLWECYLFFELNNNLVLSPAQSFTVLSLMSSLDDGGTNTFRHYVNLEWDMADPSSAAYSDGVGPDGVHGMVQRAYNGRMGTEESEGVNFTPIYLIYFRG